MAQIVSYMAHDPVGNCEGQLTDFTQSSLIDAEAQGIVFIAVYDDGSRSVVRAADIVKPAQEGQEFTFVMPVYVDKRTKATVECFDALAKIVDPEVATTSADGASTEGDPVKTFLTALEKLRALNTEAESDGDA